jgi:hypothetical protein
MVGEGTKFNWSILTDEEASRIDQEKDDRGMILHPVLWPKWPYLPVKRTVYDDDGNWKDLDTGVIFLNTGFNVYRANLFALPKTEEEFKNLPHHKYDNVDDLLADKWIVD